MKIIIEGIDGAGKTVLANKLCEQFGLEYNHHSKPYSYKQYKEMLNSKKHQLFDRFCVGQFIYNRPEERKMTEGELLELMEELLSRKDVVFIYVFPKSVGTSISSMINRGELKREEIYETESKLRSWKIRYEQMYLLKHIIERKIQTYSWEVETTWQPLTWKIQQAYYGTDSMEHYFQMGKK